MTRDELIAWATRNGWKLDHWGHPQKEFDNGWHRLRLTRLAVRHEIDTPWGWSVLSRAYYKDLSITAAGELAGMTR